MPQLYQLPVCVDTTRSADLIPSQSCIIYVLTQLYQLIDVTYVPFNSCVICMLTHLYQLMDGSCTLPQLYHLVVDTTGLSD
jgi:hypothetical protein